MDHEKIPSPKTSKLAVIVFVLTVIGLVIFIPAGFSFLNFTVLIIGLIIDSIIVGLLFLLMRWVKKKGLGGYKLAKFSFYATIVIIVIDLIASLILNGYKNRLDSFAAEMTPNFFKNDFAVLKENSTTELQELLSYKNEVKTIQEELETVGEVTRCSAGKNDFSEVSFGPHVRFNKITINLLGNYSLRCYGENKSFDILVFTEYQENKWIVDSYKLDPKLGDNFLEDKE